MKKQEYLERQLVMKRLLDVFSGMDGGCSFVDLRSFVDTCEGDTITKIFRNMGALLDVAGVATEVTIDDLPEWVVEKLEGLEE